MARACTRGIVSSPSMDPGLAQRLAHCLARPDIVAIDPPRLRALAGGAAHNIPCALRPYGALVVYAPGPTPRRLIELDRSDRLVAACRWTADGRLQWARCRRGDGRWVGLEPGAGEHPAWGRSDILWRLEGAAPWDPVERLTLAQALDYAHLDRIPPAAEPRQLGAGTGAAVLNLLAGLMEDQGQARVRYHGPYPSEQLFTTLLESFRYDPEMGDPLGTFLEGGPLDWAPAPHERHEIAPGVWMQARERIERVTVGGTSFSRVQWQGIVRRESRVLRDDGNRIVCSLWALGRPLEDCLVLDASGRVLDVPARAPDTRGPAPLPPLWRSALASLVARESAPVLAGAIDRALGGLTLQWGPVAGDLVAVDGDTVTLNRRLRDAAAGWIAEGDGPARPERAARLVREVARLVAPEVRHRAQHALERLDEDEQQRVWDEAPAEPPPLDESVGRLIALVARGGG